MAFLGRIKNVLPNAATIINGDALPVTGGTLKGQLSAIDTQLAEITTYIINKLLKTNTIKGVAHRGYSGVAPENTLSAIKLAGQLGFYGVEIDTVRIADGTWVLMHDSTVDRTTDGTGAVTGFNLTTIKALDAGSWKSQVYTGEKVPTLKEALLVCVEYDLVPFVEVKQSLTNIEAQELLAIVKDTVGLDSCVFDSFDEVALTSLRNENKNVALAHHASVTQTNIDYIKTLGNAILIPAYTELTDQSKVNLLKQNEVIFGTYTINDQDIMHTLKNSGLKIVFSDYFLANEANKSVSEIIRVSEDYSEMKFDQVISPNTYTIDAIKGEIIFTDTENSKRGYGRVWLGRINPGTLIQVTGKVKLNSGVGRVWIEQGNAEFTGGELTSILRPSNNEFEDFRIEYPIFQGNKYAQVGFGCWTADVGDISFKDINIKLINSTTNPTAEDWQTPILLNSWVNYSSEPNEATCQYYKDGDRVYLKGTIKSGTVPSTVFNLPLRYRPTELLNFATYSSSGSARVKVTSYGAVEITVGSSAWTALDGISFRVSMTQ